MYLYDIGYGSHDASQHTQLSFSRKLTYDELSDYVHKATESALRYAISHPDDFYFGRGKEGPLFETIYERVIMELKSLGFRQVKFESKWNCYGMSPLCKETDGNYEGNEEKMLRAALPEDLKSEALNIAELKGREFLAELARPRNPKEGD